MKLPDHSLVLQVFIWICLLLFPQDSRTQEYKVFTSEDFNLRGKVKHCLVITDYGREEFAFNKKGYLTKNVTRYSEKDYTITYYRFQGEELSEKREETYRDGDFDERTSLAHFYTIDTLPARKVKERILSYDKSYQDSYEYFYNKDGQLVKMIRSDKEGLDETILEYEEDKGNTAIMYYLNGSLIKSEHTSSGVGEDGSETRLEVRKQYVDGIPSRSQETVFNQKGQMLSETTFAFNPAENSFIPIKKITYNYGERDAISEVITTEKNNIQKDTYLHQFDSLEGGNWIKQIITPQNTYTTRRITYYEPEPKTELTTDQ